MTPAPDFRKAGEELAKRSRAQQGLAPRVRDRVVARRIAGLIVNGNGKAAGP
jgi:hypothetical protein